MRPRRTKDTALDRKSRAYSAITYGLSIAQTVVTAVLLFVFLAAGFSWSLAGDIRHFVPNEYLALALYVLIVLAAYYIVTSPLTFYQSFMLEHQFGLSRQGLLGWFLDQAKAGVLVYAFSLVAAESFFYLVRRHPGSWWWIASVSWILLSLVIARLVPVVIIPLFFKYKTISDGPLKQRILLLARKMRLAVTDVFEIDASSKTAKANAALVGWGSTRRVILADTLCSSYTADEIEVVLAHEFAHHKQKHLFKLLAANAACMTASFYIIFRISGALLGLLGLESLADIASLPAVALCLMALGTVMQPLENAVSRRFEARADAMALESTGLRNAFISSLNKLADQNLADRSVHPVIKYFFFDHPPVEERIAKARSAGAP